MDEGEARAAAQRRIIRRIAIAVGVVAAVCGVVVLGGAILVAVAMSQYGSNK
ncbi:MAG: hypothetical protein ABI131_12800 [Nostocoides sp.]